MFPSLEEKTMNNYLQTQERRKFRANARQQEQKPVSLKEFALCIVIGILAVIGFFTVMSAVTAQLID